LQYPSYSCSYGKYQGTWIDLLRAQALADAQGVRHKLEAIFDLDPAKVQVLAMLRASLAAPTKKKRASLAPPRPTAYAHNHPTPIATPQDSPPDSPWVCDKGYIPGERFEELKEKKSGKVDKPVPNTNALQSLYVYAHWSKILEPPSTVIGIPTSFLIHR
jgi:hypothetical protein